MDPAASTLRIDASFRKERAKATRRLRRGGVVPAILYGHGVENVALAIPSTAFERVYRRAGRSTLVDVAIDGKPPVKVLIQDVSRDPLSGSFLHVDLHQVKMTEKLTTDVPLAFVGEAKAVKELGGVLVKNIDRVTIECLPTDLVHEIPVDISRLNTFEDQIKVSDLTAPKGIAILGKPEEVVCLVEPPRSEEELKALEEKVEEKVEEVEVAKKPKTEEEVVEGEAAAATPEAAPVKAGSLPGRQVGGSAGKPEKKKE